MGGALNVFVQTAAQPNNVSDNDQFKLCSRISQQCSPKMRGTNSTDLL